MQRRPRQAVRALVVRDGHVLLAKSHDRHSPAHAWWELPGGGIEPDEAPEEALRRELREETGYVDVEVGPERWHWTTEWVFSDREVLQRDAVHVVRLRSDEQVEPEPLAHEGLDSVHWVPLGILDDLRAPVVPVGLPGLVAEAEGDASGPVRELRVPERVPWPMVNGAQVLVRLWAHEGRYDELRAAEDRLLALAHAHRGDVTVRLRPLVLDGPAPAVGSGLPDEVHVLRFPGPLELDAFLNDPVRAEVDGSGIDRVEVVPVASVPTPPTGA